MKEKIKKLIAEGKNDEEIKKILSDRRPTIASHTVEVKVLDFTKDADEPAYDVEVYIDGEYTGSPYDVFSTAEGEEEAKNKALARADEILETIKNIADKGPKKEGE